MHHFEMGGLRPPEVIEMFWREQIVVEETAEILEPVYLEAA